jgi:hypothetical protein
MKRAALIVLLVALAAPIAFADELQEPMKKVEQIRGKSFKTAVTQKTINRDQLPAFLLKEIGEAAGSPENFRRTLETMLLVEPDPKLIDKLLELYQAQVLAFYDPEEHIYYSFDDAPAGMPLTAVLEQTVTVHELVHALQDQQFDAGAKIEQVRRNWEREAAYHAVIEGEATLVMLAALLEPLGQSLDDLLENDDLVNAMTQAAAMGGGFPADAPAYFVESMKFPYFEGLKFVIAAYRRGGWTEIDELHRNPPQSTEEVLRPEMYAKRVAAKEARAAAKLDDRAWFSTELGEFYWRFLLGEQPAEGSDVSTFSIHGKGKNPTSVVQSSWDSEKDAQEFAEAYFAFLKKKGFSPRVARNGKSVRVVYGKDAAGVKALTRSR